MPDRISRYELLNKLGTGGGMGTVYRAKDTRSGQTVAIKVIHDLPDVEYERLTLTAVKARFSQIVTSVCGIAPYWQENHHYLINPNVGMRENMGLQDQLVARDWFPESWGLRR